MKRKDRIDLDLGSNQGLVGRKNPPAPADDRDITGKALPEMLEDKLTEMTKGK